MRARTRIAVLVGCMLGLLAAAPRVAALDLQSVGPTFDQPIFATAPPGDPRLFVVERPGYIQVLHDGTVSQFLDIHTMVDSNPTTERGLLSMAFDPNYAINGLFYVFFNDNGTGGASDGTIHVDEFHVSSDPNVADAASRRRVLTISHSATNHNGGQLQFGPDGLLYISLGDNANGANAQQLANPYGKLLRIDPHGVGDGDHGVPATNPFVATPGATQEIWSLGLRNPFRFSFDHATGDLTIGDVGNSQWEEIDLAPATAGGGRGVNFGWPNCEGFSGTGCGSTSTNPVFAYPHSDPGGDVAHGCAIIGGYVYRGAQAPEIAGRYLYADLCTSELRSIQLGLPLASGDRAESAPDALSSARSFGEDSACNLYVMNTDTVFRIVGSAASAAPACVPPPGTTPTPTPVVKKKKRKCKKRRRHRATAVTTATRAHAVESAKKKKRCKKHKKKRSAPI